MEESEEHNLELSPLKVFMVAGSKSRENMTRSREEVAVPVINVIDSFKNRFQAGIDYQLLKWWGSRTDTAMTWVPRELHNRPIIISVQMKARSFTEKYKFVVITSS